MLAGGGIAMLMAAALVATSAFAPNVLLAGASPKLDVTTFISRLADGQIIKNVNYTVNVGAEPRGATTPGQPIPGASPFQSLNLQGLPSLPLLGEAGPGENGNNPNLNNEPLNTPLNAGDYCPPPGPGHEYLLAWAGKMNAADIDGTDVVDLANGGAINPEGLLTYAPIEFLQSGNDMIATIDAEPGCATYGKVVNVSVISGPDGIENEAHHMQYSWYPNQTVWSGGLFSSRLFTWNVQNLPTVQLVNTGEPWATPSGSIWDAFSTTAHGNAWGTLLGGPLYNYGITPGAIVHIAGSQDPGVRPGSILGTFPANAPNALHTDGSMMGSLMKDVGSTLLSVPNLVVPTNCPSKYGAAETNGNRRAGCETGLTNLDVGLIPSECPPLGSCANPHGIGLRSDLGVLVTSDYADPALIIEDPVKNPEATDFRRTVRIWSFTPAGCSGHPTPGASSDHPIICEVDVMPNGPRDDSNVGHDENLGIMENHESKVYPLPDGKIPKGWVSESMCGGAIFYTPDITNTIDHPWHQVFDSTAAVEALDTKINPTPSYFGGRLAPGGPYGQGTEDAGCSGAAWVNFSPDNRFVVHAVNGRFISQDNFDDTGTPKMIYMISVAKMLMAGDNYQCDYSNSIRALYDPQLAGADCPSVVGVQAINDPTSGGPHFGSFDNFRLATIYLNAQGNECTPASGATPGFHTYDGVPGIWSIPAAKNGTGGLCFVDTHAPTRLAEQNYFIARSGVDGNHKVCMLNINPYTGQILLDLTFVDETEGTPCVDFNRRDWPDPNIKGFYKPHTVLFVENDPYTTPPAAQGKMLTNVFGSYLNGEGFTPYGNSYGTNCIYGAVVDGACHGYWGEPIDMGADTAGLPYQE
jgi:hypothetical protein